jgi:hypothetical protein
MAITNEQLAELLIGVARSQKAIVDAIALHLGHAEGMNFRGRALIPTLQGAANLQNRPEPTLLDLPSRVLLQIQGGANPNAQPLGEWLAQELTRIVGD